jgi:6-phosphogluconolactonase
VTSPIIRNDHEGASTAAAELIAGLIAWRLATAGVVHVALGGGHTPQRVYEMLGAMLPDWSSVHLWLGDERVVPGDDVDANVRMVREYLVAGLAPAPVLHPVETALGAEAACDAYEAQLRALVPADASGVPVLDVAFLGLGEDGHTASLFPRAATLDATSACVVVRGSPKPPPVRVTMTMPVLRAARARVVLVTGAGKAWAVARALGDQSSDIPASLLPREATTFVLDAAAASDLDPCGPGA